MEPKTYNRDTLEIICMDDLSGTLPWFKLEDDGLRLTERISQPGAPLAESECANWQANPGRKNPALPIPFTAYQFAAFTLAGRGIFAIERFESPDDEDVLNEEALALLGRDGENAREVLREAHRLRLVAVQRFGINTAKAGEPLLLQLDATGTNSAAEWLLNDAHLQSPADLNQSSLVGRHDEGLLATRGQLVRAFGVFTGMDETWFDNLTDTPALYSARKVKGHGQRGHSVEPLFCPMEVMTWLMDPRRKKGRKFGSAEKPWELLERHFPVVYVKYSAGDPRAD